MSKYLKSFVLEEMEQDPFKKSQYEYLKEIAKKQLKYENEIQMQNENKELRELFETLYADSYYCLLREYDFNPQVIKKISEVKEIRIINEKNDINGLLRPVLENDELSYEIEINLFYRVDENDKNKSVEEVDAKKMLIDSIIKTINHENKHLISTNENFVGLEELHKVDDLGKHLNEVYTVVDEFKFTSKYFNVSLLGKNVLDNEDGLLIYTNLHSYELISIYGTILDILEGEKLEYFYSKGLRESEINKVDNFEDYQRKLMDTYGNLGKILRKIGKASSLDYKTLYASANREVFRIIKDKIDNGMSIDEYLKMSKALENICFFYNGDTIFKESTKMMDLYYFYKGIFNDKNKDFLPTFEEVDNPIVFTLDEDGNIVKNSFYINEPLFQELFKHPSEMPVSFFLSQIDKLRDEYQKTNLDISSESFKEELSKLMLKAPKLRERKWKLDFCEEDFDEYDDSYVPTEDEKIINYSCKNNYLIFLDGETEEEKRIKDCFSLIDYPGKIFSKIKKIQETYEDKEEFIAKEGNFLNMVVNLSRDKDLFEDIIMTIDRKDKDLLNTLINSNNFEVIRSIYDNSMYEHMDSLFKVTKPEEMKDIFEKTFNEYQKEEIFDVLISSNKKASYYFLEKAIENSPTHLGLSEKQMKKFTANLAYMNPDRVKEIVTTYGKENVDIEKIVDMFMAQKDKPNLDNLKYTIFMYSGGLDIIDDKRIFSNIVSNYLKDNSLQNLILEIEMSMKKTNDPKSFQMLCEVLVDKNMATDIFDQDILLHLEPSYRAKIIVDLLNKDFGREAFIDKEEVDKFRDSVIDFIIRNNLNNVENEELCNEAIRFAIENDDFKKFSIIINKDFKLTESMEEFLSKEVRFMEPKTFNEILKTFETKASKETLVTFGKIVSISSEHFREEFVAPILGDENNMDSSNNINTISVNNPNSREFKKEQIELSLG